MGASVDAATGEDYRRALPQLKTRMAVYLRPSELQEHLSALDHLLRS